MKVNENGSIFFADHKRTAPYSVKVLIIITPYFMNE